jgi:hypothetical protein
MRFIDQPPITDITKALLKLSGEFGDRSQRRLHKAHDQLYIEVTYYGGHYDEAIGSPDRFIVDPRIYKELVSSGMVEGIKEIGYTSETEFEISHYGKEHLELTPPEKDGNE